MHPRGHTLDLIAHLSDKQVITMLPVNPPLLSDHSLSVVGDCDCSPPPTAPTS